MGKCQLGLTHFEQLSCICNNDFAEFPHNATLHVVLYLFCITVYCLPYVYIIIYAVSSNYVGLLELNKVTYIPTCMFSLQENVFV